MNVTDTVLSKRVFQKVAMMLGLRNISLWLSIFISGLPCIANAQQSQNILDTKAEIQRIARAVQNDRELDHSASVFGTGEVDVAKMAAGRANFFLHIAVPAEEFLGESKQSTNFSDCTFVIQRSTITVSAKKIQSKYQRSDLQAHTVGKLIEDEFKKIFSFEGTGQLPGRDECEDLKTLNSRSQNISEVNIDLYLLRGIDASCDSIAVIDAATAILRLGAVDGVQVKQCTYAVNQNPMMTYGPRSKAASRISHPSLGGRLVYGGEGPTFSLQDVNLHWLASQRCISIRYFYSGVLTDIAMFWLISSNDLEPAGMVAKCVAEALAFEHSSFSQPNTSFMKLQHAKYGLYVSKAISGWRDDLMKALLRLVD